MSDAAEILARLRGGLIVSVQAYDDSVLNAPASIALLARCAVANAAVGLRVEGPARISAVRAATGVPIVGILKRKHEGFDPYITSTREEVAAVAGAGATIVAFDATARPRVGGAGVADLVLACRGLGMLAMADCATFEEMTLAADVGADIVATTLAGYTDATAGRALPALDLVTAAANLHAFVVCEGGIGTPEVARSAFAAGADAIVVGTAITNVDELVRRFVRAAPRT